MLLLSFALRWRKTDWSCCISPSHQSPSPAPASTWSCRRYKLLATVTPLPHEPMLSPCCPRSRCQGGWCVCLLGATPFFGEEEAPLMGLRSSCPPRASQGHFRSSPLFRAMWLAQHMTAVFFPCFSPFLHISFYLASP